MAVWAIAMAALLQGQGKMDEAVKMLEDNVLTHDRYVKWSGVERDQRYSLLTDG
jgi:hypothetical protein